MNRRHFLKGLLGLALLPFVPKASAELVWHRAVEIDSHVAGSTPAASSTDVAGLYGANDERHLLSQVISTNELGPFDGNMIWEYESPLDRVIHVSQTPQASDFNDGSVDHPLRTVGEAARRVSDDGTIYVGPGRYEEEGIMRPLGLKRIQIRGLGHPKPIIAPVYLGEWMA